MLGKTPRKEIEVLYELNNGEGFYGIHSQFIVLIENRLHQNARKILNSLNMGIIQSDERSLYNKIYSMLLDGASTKYINSKIDSWVN